MDSCRSLTADVARDEALWPRRTRAIWSCGPSATSAEVVHEHRGEPDVGLRGHREEASLHVGRQPKAADELAQVIAGDATTAGELLEPLVGVIHAGNALRPERAHHGLDRLAQHLPVGGGGRGPYA